RRVDRPIAVVERLLEKKLDGEFTIDTSDGPRKIGLRGKADRLDLLADGTFRLIDYKLGWPPNRARALQLPIYSLFAEQRLPFDEPQPRGEMRNADRGSAAESAIESAIRNPQSAIESAVRNPQFAIEFAARSPQSAMALPDAPARLYAVDPSRNVVLEASAG